MRSVSLQPLVHVHAAHWGQHHVNNTTIATPTNHDWVTSNKPEIKS